MSKKPKDPAKTFTSSQVGVILEDIQSKFKFLAEGQDILFKDVAAIKTKLDMTYEKVGHQEMAIFALNAGMKSLREDVGTLKSDVATLKADVGEIKVTLKSHDARLGRIETKLDRHDARIERLESAAA